MLDFGLGEVLQLGIGGITLFLLMQVWTELKSVNEFNRNMLTRLLDEIVEKTVETNNTAQALRREVSEK
jgi:predicted DNA-binding ribbon-helix-helix protein